MKAVVSAAVAVAVAIGVSASASASASQRSTPSTVVFAADRAPLLTGEIYRIDPNGRRVDLSRSPYQDWGPAVSSDGKHVAFISDRGGRVRVFEVRIDGRGLAAMPNVPGLFGDNMLSWQPGGNVLAVQTDNSVSLFNPGHRPITFHDVSSSFTLDVAPLWSPDGKVLLLRQGLHELRAVSPDGRTLWTRTNRGLGDWVSSAAWSPAGLFAIDGDHGVAVYDESGRLRFRYRIPVPSIDALAWSPDGTALATAYQASFYPHDRYKLQVRTASGGLLLERYIPNSYSLGWAGDSTVVVLRPGRCSCHAIGVEVGTGSLSRASTRWLDTLSADRKLAIAELWRRNALGTAPTTGGPITIYRDLPHCNGYVNFGYPQFAGRSIVYASGCSPFDSLYSIGRRIHRLTNGRRPDTQPALSPDGAEIAYVRTSWSGAPSLAAPRHLGIPPCSGSDGLRIVDAATGAPIRTLTHPHECTADRSPSWSPDGQSIVYSEAHTSEAELFTIPASGGPPSDLNLHGINPAWGPSQIAYQDPRHYSGGIWTANPDGSNPTKVASKGTNPAWSSTGTLAYLVGASTVVVGGTPTHLPFASVYSLAWSRDGTRFVVVASKTKSESQVSYLQDVYTVKTDGTSPRRLTKYYDASSASAG